MDTPIDELRERLATVKRENELHALRARRLIEESRDLMARVHRLHREGHAWHSGQHNLESYS